MPIICVKLVNSVLSVSCWPVAFATPKSITFADGASVVQRDQHVGRLEVAVNNPLLMGMLHRLTDGDEQFQPLADRQRCSGRNNP